MAIRNIDAWASTAERDAVVAVKNPLAPGFGYNRATDALQLYEPDAQAWRDILPTYVLDQTRPLLAKQTITTTTLNTGAQTILAALTGYKYQLVDFSMTAIGGNAATATSVRINGTQGASTVRLVTVAVAALTQSTSVRPSSSNVTMLADGAWATPCDSGTAITVDVNNNNLATATSVLFQIWYNIIPG